MNNLNRIVQQIQESQGRKPFYLYDLDAFANHLKKFRIEGTRFWYATKANPLSHVLKVASEAGFGIDCASAGEFRQALRSGVPAHEILLTGPSKPKALLEEALDAGLRTFVLESLQQVRDLEFLASDKKIKVQGLLRLQIAWNASEASVLGGSEVSPFGLDAESWLSLKVSELQFLEIKGVHCFQWGNVMDPARLSKIWFQTAKEARELADKLSFKLEILDLGGGLGIPYAGENELAFDRVKSELKRLKRELFETEIWMELGRYAIGPYGKYVSQITDRKTVFGSSILVLEGGVHHLIRPALVGEPFPATPLLSQTKVKTQEFDLHGPLCTSLDYMGTVVFPEEIKPGDSVIFHQCGAYGFTESMPYFLCHDLPAEFILKEGEIRCARPWQKPETWLV